MYETECFPPGIEKAFKYCAEPTEQEYAMFDYIWQRQGKIFFPPAPKKPKLI